MQQKTCARLKACKINESERHNQRLKELDYVRNDLSVNNRQEVSESIAHRLDRINKIYESTVGQRMQKTAAPILECVLIVDKDTTLDQVKEFGQLCQKEFGITPFQWYLHKDEGHYDRDSGEWLPNYHAHIVFDGTEQSHRLVRRIRKTNDGKNLKDKDGKPVTIMVDGFGKTIKLNRQQMARMQDLAAQATGLERGKPSSKIGLDAIAYKLERRKEDLKAVNEDLRQAKKTLGDLTTEINVKDGELHDLIAELKQAQTRVKGLSTMIENLKEKELTLTVKITELQSNKDWIRQLTDEQADHLADLIAKQNQCKADIDDKMAKLEVADQQLKNVINQINAKQDELSVKTNKLVELTSKVAEARKEKAVGAAAMVHAVSYDYLLNDLRQAFKTEPQVMNNIFAGSKVAEYVESGEKICLTAGFLFLNMAIQAAEVAGCDGGGSSGNDLRWDGRNPGEKDNDFARRCVAHAQKMVAEGRAALVAKKKGLRR